MSFSHAALNATLNGTSGILLAGGYAAIRTGKREAHKRFMIGVRGLLRISRVLPRVPLSGGPCGIRRAGLDPPGVFCTADVAHHSGDRDCGVDSDYAAAWDGGAL